MTSSLAIIGSDQYSMQWLDANIKRFKRENVTVMLVDVHSDEQYANILERAQGLYVIPVSGQQIHDDTGLNYYPAYLTNLGFGQ